MSIAAGRLSTGDYFEFTFMLAFLIAPIAQLVNIGTQLTEALAGLDRTKEILCRARRGQRAAARECRRPDTGDVAFDNVSFAYEADKPVLHGISFEAKPGTVTALVGSSGSGKSTIISLICGFHTANRWPGADRRRGPCDHQAEQLPHAAGRGAAGDVPL